MRACRQFLVAAAAFVFATAPAWAGDPLPVYADVPRQPLVASVRRLAEALEMSGDPLPAETRRRLDAAMAAAEDATAVRDVQEALDPLCLALVTINPESRVKVSEGPVKKRLLQQGWRTFLVKVRNEAGVNPALRVASPNALPMVAQGKGKRQRPQADDALPGAAALVDRFLEVAVPAREPLKPTLSGLAVEYRPVEIFSRDSGQREATLAFDIGTGTQDIGFRGEVAVLFDCEPSVPVTLRVRDHDGSPTIASILIKDALGRVYPLPSRRLAPDFFFQEQVYRADGEQVMLPAGSYTFTVGRGPEYRQRSFAVSVPAATEHTVEVALDRWIHTAGRGWYSGDHHIHAAGCAHYDSPTEGVGPEAMLRHVRGEDLAVGCVLTWGPCWYTQKRFFDGRVSALSGRDAVMRYDVEVSGFPSSHAGHVCLLRLTEDEYPGADTLEEWPSWTLPILRWARKQGAVTGYAHSGFGLAPPDVMPDGARAYPPMRGYNVGDVPDDWPGKPAVALPDAAVPRFDGIGSNEFIVAAAHGLVDFTSVADSPAAWELNIWYHVLNCGLTPRISGETDFPCITDARVGQGRVYVGLDPGGGLTYDAWVEGLRDGRSYCGDGRSHVIDLTVGGLGLGRPGTGGAASRLDLDAADSVTVVFEAAALLPEKPDAEARAIRSRRPDRGPYWHLERCRIGDSRKVPVEVIVNGRVAATREFEADGHLERFEIPVSIERSSWVAVRILPSLHTNPVFVHVGGRPIRAARASAAWCRRAVDVCWASKRDKIRPEERDAAQAAYDAAAAVYDRVLAECPAD
jgi:hypothetical protein